MIIAIENPSIKISYVEVFPAVIVIVADCNPESPAAVVECGFRSYIAECAVVVVAVELSGVTFARVHIFQVRTVDQVNVHPAVVVIVEHGDAATHCFHDVTLFESTAGKMEIDSGGASNVGEGD